MKIIIAILIIIGLYLGIKRVHCMPDKKILEVSLPLAKAIKHYIDHNDAPDYVSEIQNLPVKLDKCSRDINKYEDYSDIAIELKETCNFKKNNKTYIIKYERRKNNARSYDNIELRIGDNKTGTYYEFRYFFSTKLWHPTEDLTTHPYKITHASICKPFWFRITD